MSALLLAVVVLFLVILVGAPYMAFNASRHAWRENEARLAAENALLRLEVRRAREFLSTERVPDGLSLLARLVREHPTNRTLSSWLVNELTHRSSPRPLFPAIKHPDIVNAVQFSPDGERLLTASEDGTARIWDVETGKTLMEPMRHRGRVWSARFSPAGDVVATASADATVQLWDVRLGQALPVELPLEYRTAYFLGWSSDGRMIATSGDGGGLWDTGLGKKIGMGDALWGGLYPDSTPPANVSLQDKETESCNSGLSARPSRWPCVIRAALLPMWITARKVGSSSLLPTTEWPEFGTAELNNRSPRPSVTPMPSPWLDLPQTGRWSSPRPVTDRRSSGVPGPGNGFVRSDLTGDES